MSAAAIILPPPALPNVPSNYHRILSPDVRVSDDKTQAIPVGLLACQRNPSLRELRTNVVGCRVHRPDTKTSTSAKSGNRKKATNDTKNASVLLEVILHDTVLFPEGGGQPTDTGVLKLDTGETLDVVEVKRHGGVAVHYVRVGEADTANLLSVGVPVLVALDDSGFVRRLDHMCMHTSQHLLSAVLETHFSLPTLSWALTTFPTPSYVEIPRSLTEEEISEVQAITHTLAYEGRAVHVEVEPLRREGPDANHPGVAIHESGRSVGKALPEDYTGGVKRVVVIDGVDRNPCCGTHLPSLHNLQLFLLPQTETLARGGTNTSRLYFLCGPRLHEHLKSSHKHLLATANTLSCGPSSAPERVLQVVEERKRMTKRSEELATELAQLIASNFVQEMVSEHKSGDKQQLFTRYYHRTDDVAEALPFLQAVSFSFNNAVSSSSSANGSFVLVLVSSAASQTSTSPTTILLNSSDAKTVQTVAEGLKARLGAKGGGKGTRWSGKWLGVWKEGKEGSVVKEILDGVKLEQVSVA